MVVITDESIGVLNDWGTCVRAPAKVYTYACIKGFEFKQKGNKTFIIKQRRKLSA